MNVKEAAKLWGISERRVRVLCANGQIDGAFQYGKLWVIPDGAEKPADGRIKTKASLLELINQKNHHTMTGSDSTISLKNMSPGGVSTLFLRLRNRPKTIKIIF